MSAEHLLRHFGSDLPLAILDLGYGIANSDASAFEPDTATDNLLRAIQLQPNRSSFDDGHFDCVISSQVLKHVMDYESTVRVIQRVQNPGGISLHTFPSRRVLIGPLIKCRLPRLYETGPSFTAPPSGGRCSCENDHWPD